MTPQPNRPPLRTAFPRWVKWLLAAVPVSGLIASAARAYGNVETKTHADSVFVRKDTFAIYQAGEALTHRTDSLVIEARTQRIDDALNALLRACRRKGECQ